MINHIYGPDGVQYVPPPPPYNDDDDGDPFSESKPHHSPSVAIIGGGASMQLVSVFNDQSWRLVPDPPYSSDWSVGLGRSSDRGLSWIHDLARGIPESPPPPGYLPPPPGGWRERQRDPSVAVGGNGRVYMVGRNIDMDTAQGGVWLARSDDGGATWTTSMVTVNHPDPPEPRYVEGRAVVIADRSSDPQRRDRVYVMWVRHPYSGTYFEGRLGSIYLAISTDGGQTFLQPPAHLSYTPTSGPEATWCPAGAVGPDGEFYPLWTTEGYFAGQTEVPAGFEYRIVTYNGQTFGFEPALGDRPYMVNWTVFEYDPLIASGNYQTIRYSDQASIAVSWARGTRGRVYVAFASEHYEPAIESDVYLTWTDSPHGSPWSTPARLNDDPVQYCDDPPIAVDINQFMPEVRVDTNGRVGAAWYDNREDNCWLRPPPDDSWNNNYHIFFAYSLDGGLTFNDPGVEDNIKLTCNESDTLPWWGWRPGSPPGYIDIGYYSGLAAYGRWFVPVFTSLERWDTYYDRNWWQLVGDILTATVEIKEGPPDYDYDCDVDTGDFTIFQLCFGGSGNPPAPTCPPTSGPGPYPLEPDLDGDGDVDLADFSILQLAYTGSYSGCGDPAGPSCGGGEGEGGAMAPEGSPNGTLPDPAPEEWDRMLYEYCLANGIPFN